MAHINRQGKTDQCVLNKKPLTLPFYIQISTIFTRIFYTFKKWGGRGKKKNKDEKKLKKNPFCNNIYIYGDYDQIMNMRYRIKNIRE